MSDTQREADQTSSAGRSLGGGDATEPGGGSAGSSDAWFKDVLRLAGGLEGPGALIGRYKLIQEIGEGGFGVVYMAEQREPVARKVALKIIKLGMDTRQVVARFEQERQALALMDHPHIAKVFDAGATDAGRPYFVMEFCAGEPVTRYCDKEQLSIPRRLNLFVQICHAVQHAHQKGIIHRDIKPSNVLVQAQDDGPHAKVIDFGIAKATAAKLTDKTLFTEHRQLIGTPHYMSPEQAEGSLDIDTRTDVYSLGVMLYELLVGVTPFDPKSLRAVAHDEIARIIREVEPSKPSTRLSGSAGTLSSVAANRRIEPRKLGTLIRGDLDWIVMKAMEKDRTRRYETAVGLAADVQNYLAGQPVTAAPPSAAYRLRKFVRRNRVPVTLAAAVTVTLVLGVVGTTLGRIEADAARAEAARKQHLAESVNSFYSEEILGRADPDRTDPGRPVTLKEAVDLAAEKVEGRFADEPLIRATIHDALGDSYRGMGYYDEALSQLKPALEIRRASLPPDDPETLKAAHSLATVYRMHGLLDLAEPLYVETLEARRRTLGDDDPDTHISMTGLAILYQTQGRSDQAVGLLEAALAGQRKTLGERDIDTIQTMNTLAHVYHSLKDVARAEAMSREALRLLQDVVGPDHPDTTAVMGVLSAFVEKQGRHDEAVALLRDAEAIERRVLGADHPSRISSLASLALALEHRGDYEEALALYEEAVDTSRGSARLDRGILANCLAKLGGCLITMKRYPEAESVLLEAWPVVLESFGPEHYRTRRAAKFMVRLYEDWEKPEQAREWKEKAAVKE